jgi:hypothetical protein
VRFVWCSCLESWLLLHCLFAGHEWAAYERLFMCLLVLLYGGDGSSSGGVLGQLSFVQPAGDYIVGDVCI